MPHFGDQGENARNLIENGAALPLYDTSYGDRSVDDSTMDLSLTPIFDG